MTRPLAILVCGRAPATVDPLAGNVVAALRAFRLPDVCVVEMAADGSPSASVSVAMYDFALVRVETVPTGPSTVRELPGCLLLSVAPSPWGPVPAAQVLVEFISRSGGIPPRETESA